MNDNKSEAPSRVYVVFTATINAVTIQHFIQVLTDLSQKEVAEVYLAYSTPGGNIKEGITLYNFLRGVPFNLITHNIGNVDSIGKPSFLAADTRYACLKSSFMFHNFHWTTQARSYRQNEFMEMAKELKAGQDFVESILVERTKVTKNQAKKFFREGKTLLAEHAHDLGIINEVKEFAIPPGAP